MNLNLPRIKNQTRQSGITNNNTFIDYYSRLEMLARSVFSWKNLDNICGVGAENNLERALFENGKACIVKDDKIGYLCLDVNPDSNLNVYYLPTKVEAFSTNYHKTFNFDNIVYVKNNVTCMPTSFTIMLLAERLYETERTIDVNRNAQKTPVLIEGDKKSILTLKNLYQQYSGNNPFVFGNENFNLSQHLNVLKTEAPYLIDKLMIHKHDLLSEAMTYLGIDNFFTTKKERVVQDEVSSNDDITNAYLNIFYKTRKDACDQFNEMLKKNGDTDKGFVEISINRIEVAKLKAELEIEINKEREIEDENQKVENE